LFDHTPASPPSGSRARLTPLNASLVSTSMNARENLEKTCAASIVYVAETPGTIGPSPVTTENTSRAVLKRSTIGPVSPSSTICASSSDAREDSEHIVVIPSGAMLAVPVDALVDGEGNYMGNRYVVSYAFLAIGQVPARPVPPPPTFCMAHSLLQVNHRM
jgi:hypothetical protein